MVFPLWVLLRLQKELGLSIGPKDPLLCRGSRKRCSRARSSRSLSYSMQCASRSAAASPRTRAGFAVLAELAPMALDQHLYPD
jgi:hypothetical protein